MLAGELKFVFKRYGVQPQNKVLVRFVSKDLATVEITFDPLQGAVNSLFEAAPRRLG